MENVLPEMTPASQVWKIPYFFLFFLLNPSLSNWTRNQKMALNKKKCKSMFFNFSRNYQFSSRLKIDNEIIETVQEIKLLGTTITNDLKWAKNTEKIVKKRLTKGWNY